MQLNVFFLAVWFFLLLGDRALALSGFKVVYNKPSAPVSGWVALTNSSKLIVKVSTKKGSHTLLTFRNNEPSPIWQPEGLINNFMVNDLNEMLIWAGGAYYVSPDGGVRGLCQKTCPLTSLHDFNNHQQIIGGNHDLGDPLLKELWLFRGEARTPQLLVRTLDEGGQNGEPFINLGHARINNQGVIVFMAKEGSMRDRMEPDWQNDAEIYRVDRKGHWQKVRRQGSYQILPYRPFWVTDQNQVIYEAKDLDGAFQYFVTDLDQSGRTWQVGQEEGLSQVRVLASSRLGRILFTARDEKGGLSVYLGTEGEKARVLADLDELITLDGQTFRVDRRYGLMVFGAVNDREEVLLNVPLVFASDQGDYGSVLFKNW